MSTNLLLHIRRTAATTVLLVGVGGLGGCGWKTGPVAPPAGWAAGAVTGASVEPAVLQVGAEVLSRSIASDGPTDSGPPVDLHIQAIGHTPEQVRSGGRAGWRTEVQLTARLGHCEAVGNGVHRWASPSADQVGPAREQAVTAALEQAVRVALDRLLVQGDCR